MTFTLKSAIKIVIPSLIIVGCSHNPPPRTEPKEPIFSTQIKPDGKKMFNLHLATESQRGPQQGDRGAPPGGRSQGPPPEGGGGKGQSPEKRQDEKHQQAIELEQRLQDKLYETKYCRDGYTLKDTYIGFSFQVITGSCIDLANAEDRYRFPNTDDTDIR